MSTTPVILPRQLQQMTYGEDWLDGQRRRIHRLMAAAYEAGYRDGIAAQAEFHSQACSADRARKESEQP